LKHSQIAIGLAGFAHGLTTAPANKLITMEPLFRIRYPPQMILSLLDQASILGFKGSVGFHHYSEPLLDDRNIPLAQEAKQGGMKPYLHTNKDLLKRDDQLCKDVINYSESIVVGHYDYANNTQLEHARQYLGK